MVPSTSEVLSKCPFPINPVLKVMMDLFALSLLSLSLDTTGSGLAGSKLERKVKYDSLWPQPL